MWLLSVQHMVNRECHCCTSLQCGKMRLHLCLLYYQELSVEIGLHIQTLYGDGPSSLPWDIHSTLWSRMMGRCIVQGSLQQSLVLKCNTQHMEHYVQQQIEMVHYHQNENHQSHTQTHTGMLVHSAFQEYNSSTVAALEHRGNLLHLLDHSIYSRLPFQHTVAVFQKCWDMWSSPTWCTPHHQ